ncbi:PREDICTED: translocon-associated protein subunit delta [Rhagoletis zephyria]|uniref:translocon-associated protein subunit delta n=1 Tax=Rhagoletis zephyria TaxID=28612 RepID=UPI0008114DF5|nr:PREDICTED: translocon-associated protein subunit delta [Rhagoletis zephyria]
MSHNILAVFVVCLFSGAALATTCTSPKVSVTSFSTQDATILTQVAHIGEFSLKCGNNVPPNLFAEFACGKIVPVAKLGDDKYQVSWTQEIKKSGGGNVVVRLFDEEGYANVRKAQRDGDKVANVKSLVDITVATKGAYKGPWVKAELVAALAVGGIAYFAFTAKSKVQG